MSEGPHVVIGDRIVGRARPVFIVAEIGVNHDGVRATALELIDAAARMGADAVKIQTFDPAKLVSSGADLASYQRRGETQASNQEEMLQRLRLNLEDHQALARRCAERGVVFLSTPFDLESAALLASLGVPAFKVGSGELTNIPFLEELAAYGLPMLVSTGMAELEEVRLAVETIQRAGTPLVLLQCTSSYPAPPDEANLRAMDLLRDAFGTPVGYSDHCLGLQTSLAAVARDACILERHFTLDRTRPGPDHAMSLEPEEFGELVEQVRAVERSLGDGLKVPQPSELELRRLARRSIVAARPLCAGEILTIDALAIKRPGGGLAPALLRSVVGARLARSLEADEPLTSADIEVPG